MLVLSAGMFAYVSWWVNIDPPAKPTFGITFSTLYSDQLGLVYDEVYEDLLEMGVKQVRLPIYWSEIEHSNNEYQWERFDRLFELSERYEVSLIPVVGVKVPRWPECFIPDWAEALDETYQHEEVMDFIELAVNRYKDSPSVIRWQVENEPFFPFGECPDISSVSFQERVNLVRSLDDKPIQVTVSGEIGPWHDALQAADVLGLSMYRQTWNDFFGYFMYPLSPEVYFLRASFAQGEVDRVVVSELQAEPWFPEAIENKQPVEWYENFTVEMFEQNLQFAEETGMPEVYLWGAEWWYFLKQNGEPRLWDRAQNVFN